MVSFWSHASFMKNRVVSEWFWEENTILKIYIESLQTVCEGVLFSLKFQVRTCNFTKNKLFYRHVSNLGDRGTLDIFCGEHGASHIAGGEVS